jgi:hypothetical protein
LGDLDVDGRIVLKMDLREIRCEDVYLFEGLRMRSIDRTL